MRPPSEMKAVGGQPRLRPLDDDGVPQTSERRICTRGRRGANHQAWGNNPKVGSGVSRGLRLSASGP